MDDKGHIFKGLGAGKTYDMFTPLFGMGSGFYQKAIHGIWVEPGMRILDLGCGTGKLLFALADQAPADSEFYGCDYSPDQLRYAERVAVRYRQRIHFTHASMDELRFPDSYFDIVMSSMALHAANPGIRKKAISEVSRMLKANGIFLLLESGTPRFGLITLLFSLFGKMHTRNAYDPCLTDEYCRGSCLKIEKESYLNSLVRRQIFRKYT